MKTILENIDYYNDEEFNKAFLPASLGYLTIIENNNSIDSLKKIKFSKLQKVAEDLDLFWDGDEVRKEKKLFISYLRIFVTRPIAVFSFKDLLVLERDYLLPIIDGKLRDKGWDRKHGWLLVAIFTLPIDIILFSTIEYYYFPLLSLYFMVDRLFARRKAGKEKRLW